ncbi:flagellar brake protein [Pseudomonas wenzhouensis]|nr:flagellar brake protein [Pseudomonas wenzhouensis]MDM9651005.1 flagellar brake protein [Pseudomonas wenzhouensis]
MALIPVTQEDIEITAPLPSALLDASGRVVYPAGSLIDDPLRLAEHLTRGLFRDSPVPQAQEAKKGEDSAAKLRLAPGDTLQMQAWDGNSERYLVKVVGFLAPLSLLVTAPNANGKLVFVREGQVFLVRGFVGQNVLAYRTRVLKTQLSPFPYLHLAYPESVQSMRIRKSARIPVDLVAAINCTSGNSAGRIADLSLDGAKVLSHAAFAAVGEEIKLSFRVTAGGMEFYLKLRAIVRAVQQEQADSAHVATGLEFTALNEQERLALIGVVHQNLP